MLSHASVSSPANAADAIFPLDAPLHCNDSAPLCAALRRGPCAGALIPFTARRQFMPGDKADVVMFGPKPIIEDALTKAGHNLHRGFAAPDQEGFINSIAPKVRAIAAVAGHGPVNGAIMSRFPKLEIVSSFGVGYDHIDAKWAGEHGIVVTNTPDVLNEEVADTALGLLLNTVREFPQAERYLRAGKWVSQGHYPLTKATLRNRTVGMVGMGRIGKAIAKRLDAFGVPVA